MNLEYRHLNWMEFIWDVDLSTKAKILAAYLCRHMNKDHHVCWPSLNLIAEKTGLSRRSVMNAANELEDAGWLIRERGGPNSGSTHYMPTFPRDIEKKLGRAGGALGRAGGALGRAGGALDVGQEVPPNQSNRISQKKKPMSGTPDEREIIDYLNKCAGKNYKHVESNFKFVRARLNEGHTLVDLKAVVDDKCRQWLSTSQEQYLRPATLFNAEKFNQYHGQIGVQTGEANKRSGKQTRAEANHEYLQQVAAELDAAPVCEISGTVYDEMGRHVPDPGPDGGRNAGMGGPVIPLVARRNKTGA